MRNNLYIVYDKIAQMCIGGLIRVSNDEVARRSFHEALIAKDSPMANHQGDYALNKLGHIDEQTGIIEAQDIPTVIADGQDWLNANKERTA